VAQSTEETAINRPAGVKRRAPRALLPHPHVSAQNYSDLGIKTLAQFFWSKFLLIFDRPSSRPMHRHCSG
jgi:hypothetical protein